MDKALANAKRAVELNEDLAIAHVKLGRVYESTGQHEEAIAAFQQALKQDPSQSEAHRWLGRSYEKMGRVEDAEAAFVDAVKLRPNDWQTHSLLAIFYMRHGRYLEAEAALRSAIELAPNDHINYRNLAGVYHLMGRPGEAKTLLEKSVAIEPTAKAYSNLGTIYFFEGRYREAAKVFEMAIDLGGNEDQAWGNLADAHRWVPGANAQAEAAYRRAIDLAEQKLDVNPNDTRCRSSLAVYWAKLGETARATEELNRLPPSAGSNVNIRFKITVVHELTGHRDQALDGIQSLLRDGYSLTEIENEPELTELRRDPRYEKIAPSRQSCDAASLVVPGAAHNLDTFVHTACTRRSTSWRYLVISCETPWQGQPSVRETLKAQNTVHCGISHGPFTQGGGSSLLTRPRRSISTRTIAADTRFVRSTQRSW